MSLESVIVRVETPADEAAVWSVHNSAFDTPAEADLVNALRGADAPLISLVAEQAGDIVGHILFSPVCLNSEPPATLAGLAPMAVRPDRQSAGIGSELVGEGLWHCKRAGYPAVVVLGHAEYYPRFGFRPAAGFGIDCEYDVPAEVFMLKELNAGALEGLSGTAAYHPLFNQV